MDEDDLVRTGMEIVLRPVTDIASDALGLAGGDWLHERRNRARARLKEKMREILRERKVKPQDASPTILLPLLSSAQDETREELLELWARLLSAAVDPAKANLVRRSFIEAVAQMEPFDAAVFDEIATGAAGLTIAGNDRQSDKVLVSLAHLHQLGCVDNGSSPVSHFAASSIVVLNAFGRELFSVLGD
jgi:hypothetical protein